MIEIFNDLYKKVMGFFQTQEKENTKENACNRLKLVLMQDRTNLTPFLLEKMRGEMIEVLSKYVEMDKEALELNFEQEGEQMALMLSIPVLRAKEEEEIQAILDAEEKAKQETENSEEETEDLEGVAESDESDESEDEDEEVQEAEEEETCTAEVDDEDVIDESTSPDFEEEVEEESSEKKSKKRK